LKTRSELNSKLKSIGKTTRIKPVRTKSNIILKTGRGFKNTDMKIGIRSMRPVGYGWKKTGKK